MKCLPVLLLALVVVHVASAQVQRNRGGNPFEAPNAKMQYVPDRTFDLKNILVRLEIDYPNRSIRGYCENRFTMLRDFSPTVTLHAGKDLKISSVSLNGRPTTFERKEEELIIAVPKMKSGAEATIRVDYAGEKQKGGGFGTGGRGGWHWIDQDPLDLTRAGFWTQGESEFNREWAPTWDSPNDFATSETIVTVDADWTVIGNGTLISDKKDGDKRTFTWRMTQPHATYLLSLVGGPLDIKKDKWEGKDLWYVVPRGRLNWIDASFGDTKDMLTFFSDTVGVKYAWPKYAQNAMYDFGGGMENVSSTTLGAGSLTDGKDGFRTMASLNSHELGHQWFGDLVSCRNWGDSWLNESFATYMQMIYFEHSRGLAAYQREINQATQSYLNESRRYQRPVATRFYSNPDAMFDSHAYPKGGTILHTLRRQLGDQAFYAGIKHYLDTNRHSPVETTQLARGISDGSGINVEPFFEQWVLKPGHPVIEYTWTYANGKLTVNVDQTQKTDNGTPIYKIPARIGVIADGKYAEMDYPLDAAKHSREFAMSATPTAVIFDPRQDFLREMKHTFAPEEMASIFEFAPNAVDRTAAFEALGKSKSAADIALIRRVLEADRTAFPTFDRTTSLGALKDESLRSFWNAELEHPNSRRRTAAVSALQSLGLKPAEVTKLESMVNDKEWTPVVTEILSALDPKTSTEAFRGAAKISSRSEQIKRTALGKLVAMGDKSAESAVLAMAESSSLDAITAGIGAMSKIPASDRTRAILRRTLTTKNNAILLGTLEVISNTKDKSMLPDLQKAQSRTDFPRFVRTELERLIKELS